MQNNKLLIISIFFFLILLVPTSAIQQTANPSPTIHVDYASIDADLNIVSSILTFPSGFTINLGYDTENGYDYVFPVNAYLFPGMYHFRIVAEDNDNNRIVTEDNLEILESPKNLWIEQPKITYLEPETQNIGMGQSLPFNLEVKTKIPSICRIKRFYPPLPADPEQIYLGAGFTYFNNDPNSLSTTHQVNVKPNGQATPQYELPINNVFNYDNVDLGAYIIICKQESAEGEVHYFLKKVHIGYDDTNPVFNVSFEPPIIEDEYAVETTMKIETENDLVACSYEYQQNPEPKQNDISGQIPLFHTISSINDYSKNITKKFTFLGKAFDLNKDYDFTILIDCHNPAQRHTTKTVNYKIHLTRDLDISLEKNYFTTKNPQLNFTTNLHAICSYQLGDTNGIITSTPQTEHLLQLNNLEDDNYEINIHCETVGVGGVIDKNFNFVVSADKPSDPELSGTKNTCGNPNVELKIKPSSTKKVRYNISLYANNQLISNELYPTVPTSEEVDYTLPAEPLLTSINYEWRVEAIDMGGLKSNIVKKTFHKTNYDGIICDETPPEGNAEITITSNGFEVGITCTDTQSGCEDYFNYKEVDFQEECSFNSLQSKNYEDLPLVFNENKKLCYQLIDKAGNVLNKSQPIKAAFEINLIKPVFGVASTKSFDLEIQTSRNAICKQGYLAPTHYTELSDWYNSLLPFDSDGSAGLNHHVNINANNILQLNENLDKSYSKWVVICNASGLLLSKIIEPFGFDTTPPIITPIAEPNPVIEPGLLETVLTVNTDDKTVCTYKGNTGGTKLFPDYDIENPFVYTYQHEANLRYSGVHDDFIDSQKIECRNYAQLNANKNYDINVTPINKIQITINHPEISTESSFMLNVSTAQLADCKYKPVIENDDTIDFVLMSTTGSHEHLQQINLLPGTQSYDILCTALTNGDEGIVTTEILFDNEKPTVNIQSSANSCSLNKIKFSIVASDEISGIDHCEYNLKFDSGLEVNKTTNNFDVEELIPLIEGDNLKITVTCYDKLNNENSASTTMKVTNYDSSICDTTPPTSRVTFSASWNGFKVNIYCDDDVACSNSFSYYLSSTEKCEENKKTSFEYSSLPIEINNSATLCYSVFDAAGNKNNGSKYFHVEQKCFNQIEDPGEEGVDCGGICIAKCGTCGNNQLDPGEEGVDCGGVCETFNSCSNNSNSNRDFEINLINPIFGLASTKDFILKINTTKSATCHQGYLGEAHPEDLFDWYKALLPFDSDGSDGIIHTVNIKSNEIMQLDQNKQTSMTSWIIICNHKGLLKTKQIIPFGFDTTPPVINVKAEPNPVVDPGLLETTLTVSTKDKTICTYTNKNGISGGFPGYDVNDPLAYKTAHTKRIKYWGVHNQYNDSQNIKCRNKAQLHSEKDYVIKVSPENKIQITSNTKNYSQTKEFTLDVSTAQLANCKFRKNSDDAPGLYTDFAETGGTKHTQKVNLDLGEQTFDVLCKASGTGNEGIVSLKVIYDNIPPKIKILTEENTCSLKQIHFSLLTQENISGINYFEYNITGPNGSNIFKRTTHSLIQENIPLVSGAEYSIKIIGLDKAGNKGEASKTITAKEFDANTCDTSSPKAKLTYSKIWTGYNLTVSCEDDVACAEEFSFQFAENKDCEGIWQTKQYTEQPITINKSTTFCYEIFDKAGNSANGTKQFIVSEDCFNGMEDPDEEGVDCGGVCEARCGTCDNKKQDFGELGVDCGGVCETFQKCGDNILINNSLKLNDSNRYTGENYTDSGNSKPECQTTADCQQGYFCNYKHKCEFDETTKPPKKNPYENKNNSSSQGGILGLLLIILGILFMGGGSCYIYYSRNQKAIKQQRIQQRQINNNYVASTNIPTKEDLTKKAAMEKRLEVLKEQHLKQQEVLKKKLSEKKEKRKSLLNAFEIPDSTKEKYSVYDNDSLRQSPKKTSEIKEEKEKEEAKLDEGFKEEFIDVRKLGTKPKQAQEAKDSSEKIKTEKTSTSTKQTRSDSKTNKPNALDELSSLISPNKSTKKDSSLEKSTTKSKNKNKVKEANNKSKSEDALDELEELESLDKDNSENSSKNNTQNFENKDELESLEELNKDVESTEKKSETPEEEFEALEEMIDSTGEKENNKKKKTDYKLKNEKTISSSELLNMFEKEKTHLDVKTLLSTLNLLLDEKKIDKKIIKDVLNKMAEKKFIKEEEIETLYKKLIN